MPTLSITRKTQTPKNVTAGTPYLVSQDYHYNGAAWTRSTIVVAKNRDDAEAQAQRIAAEGLWTEDAEYVEDCEDTPVTVDEFDVNNHYLYPQTAKRLAEPDEDARWRYLYYEADETARETAERRDEQEERCPTCGR